MSYATLIEAHARAGQLTAAQNWAAAAEMDGVGMEPYVATALLKAHVQAGDLKVRTSCHTSNSSIHYDVRASLLSRPILHDNLKVHPP